MTKTSKTLIFFGNGPVGLASLEALSINFEIEAVVTKPDPMSSRNPALVADFARKQGYNLHQPESKQALDELIASKPFTSEVGVIVDYGIIVSQKVIDYFPKGIVNSHFSLLPEWRGADPITFALLSGQSLTGVSLMLINATLDTGKLLAQAEYNIDGDENILTLTENLVELSNKTLEEILPKYFADEIVPFDQDTSVEATYSRKLTKADGLIDWTKSAEEISREVRAFLGWPGSQANLGGKDVTITEVKLLGDSGKPSKPFTISKSQFGVYCGNGALEIFKLKPAGKSEMTAQAFLAGNKI